VAAPVPPARPDFADAIDAIVADMVTFGQVIWDDASQMYIKPPRRRVRFAR
jgi:hypothetical protein